MDEDKARRFGAFIGRKREEQGLSQTALAKAAEISRPYLTQIENGQRMPSDDVAQRLIILLGAPMEEFMAELLGPELDEEQRAAITRLTAPMTQMAKTMSPEALMALTNEMQTMEQMAADMMKLAPLEQQRPLGGPDGWLELSAEDRRLVQRIVNRLLKEQ